MYTRFTVDRMGNRLRLYTHVMNLDVNKALFSIYVMLLKVKESGELYYQQQQQHSISNIYRNTNSNNNINNNFNSNSNDDSHMNNNKSDGNCNSNR